MIDQATTLMDRFTEEQDQLISDMLDEGYTPERLSGYLARLNDLDDIYRLAIRQRAADMAAA